MKPLLTAEIVLWSVRANDIPSPTPFHSHVADNEHVLLQAARASVSKVTGPPSDGGDDVLAPMPRFNPGQPSGGGEPGIFHIICCICLV